MNPVRLEIDHTAGAAYVTLSDAEVVSTVEVTDEVCIDLDAFGVAVGIEILNLAAQIPMDRKPCRWVKEQAKYQNNKEAYKERARVRNLKAKYNLTVEEYEEMFSAQDGKCAICFKEQPDRRLSVDHDHSCCPGQVSCGLCVRKLLCVKCNSLIGLANDDIDLLLSAVSYLEGE